MALIRTLVVDDHTVVRQALRALLDAETDIQVVGEAGNGRQAVQLVETLAPEVVIMDVVMPFMNGIEATRQIVRLRPSVKVLILSSHDDEDFKRHIATCGAAGCIFKVEAAAEMLRAVRLIHSGQRSFPPAFARHLDRRVEEWDGCTGSISGCQLSPRELEVLKLIAEGRANKEIAAELCISIKTVEKHRQSLMDKLNIHEIAGLTRYAISSGIVEVAAVL